MTKKHYDWANGPAVIDAHSITKHSVLREYLIEYLVTLTQHFGKDRLSLSIIDGFCGGGVYTMDGQEILGSPFVLLDAVEHAKKLINLKRIKPVEFDIEYWFIDKDPRATAFLKQAFIDRGVQANHLHIVTSTFEEQADRLIEAVQKKTPKAGRSIFVLDQYGYSQVPIPKLHAIFSKLNKAEVLLTFHFDALARYATSNNLQAALDRLGAQNILEGHSIEQLKREHPKGWKAVLQNALYREITSKSGAKFHTPFYIRSSAGSGEFWLLHLSSHAKARDVMTGVHWSLQNQCVHYGQAGIIFKAGYVSAADSTYTKQVGFGFDEDAHALSIRALVNELPEIIEAKGSIEAHELFVGLCNDLVATEAIMVEALQELASGGVIQVSSADGKPRARSAKIDGKDLLSMNQKSFHFL